ncbi:hypothetical protein JCM11491_001788 [Sporobolomyces phaffii]
MPHLNKSSILFVFLNLLRFLSIVAICLSFTGEVVTMVNDLSTVQSASSSPSPAPTSTATTNIFRRSVPDPVFLPSVTPEPVLHRREPASLRELDSATASTTATRRSSAPTTTTARSITATNTPAPTSTLVPECSYVSSTSIPTQPGGSLFSTLSRIFGCLILLASLVSELSPPITTRAGQLVERWWTYVFPPFGRDFGTGVLGGVQVFMGCTVLSHAVGKFTQVSGWFLFVVGILNLLCGLAFGSRLKVIRSPFADSTSPSALRQLRLASSDPSTTTAKDPGGDRLESVASRARATADERRKWYRFDNASSATDPGRDAHAAVDMSGLDDDNDDDDAAARRVRFTPSAVFGAGATGRAAGPKRSQSRNGPNGIVISGPMHLRGGGGGGANDDDRDKNVDVYGEMEEVRNGASSRASTSRGGGGGGVSVPPPVYSGGH